MSETLRTVRSLIAIRKVRVSDHAYDELADDGLLLGDVISGVDAGTVVEDYPTYAKGPCVLVLQTVPEGVPIHAIWGLPAGATEPAVLITVYRPDPSRWDATFTRRR